MKYAEQVADFPEEVQDELLREYSSAKKVGTQRYMSRVMIFFRGRNIYAVQYKDITGAAPKGRDLLMYLKDSEEPLRIPCPAHGMAGIVYAFLRSKNPDIKIIGSADRKETTV
jgi:predicted Ser/Thr protein kinase